MKLRLSRDNTSRSIQYLYVSALAIPSLGNSQEKWEVCPQKVCTKIPLVAFIPDSQKLEAAQMSNRNGVGEKGGRVVYIHTMYSQFKKKVQITDKLNNMDKSWKHYTEWKKPDTWKNTIWFHFRWNSSFMVIAIKSMIASEYLLEIGMIWKYLEVWGNVLYGNGYGSYKCILCQNWSNCKAVYFTICELSQFKNNKNQVSIALPGYNQVENKLSATANCQQ